MTHVGSRPICWRIARIVGHSSSLFRRYWKNISTMSTLLFLFKRQIKSFDDTYITMYLPALALYQQQMEIEFGQSCQGPRWVHDHPSNCWLLEAVRKYRFRIVNFSSWQKIVKFALDEIIICSSLLGLSPHHSMPLGGKQHHRTYWIFLDC